MLNENAIAKLRLDVDFLDEELRRNGHSHGAAFTELRSVRPVLHFPSSIDSPPSFISPHLISIALAARLISAHSHRDCPDVDCDDLLV